MLQDRVKKIHVKLLSLWGKLFSRVSQQCGNSLTPFQLKSCIILFVYMQRFLFFLFNHLVNCNCHFIVQLKPKQYFSYLSHFLQNGIWSEILGSIRANISKQLAGNNLVHATLPSTCNLFCCFYPFSDYLDF